MLNLDHAVAAFEEVESASGHNNYPRFEVSYAPAGKFFTIQGRILKGTGANFNDLVASRWAKYGMASACSYGKTQILYHTAADLGFQNHPAILWANEAVCDFYVRKRLEWLIARKHSTIDLLADGWNSGWGFDRNVPDEYVKNVVAAYNRLEFPTT